MLGVFLGLCILLFAFYARKSSKEKNVNAKRKAEGMIKLTDSAVNYAKKDYKELQSLYKELGFKKITVINLKDLKTRLIKKPGTVAIITINGEEPESGKWYHCNEAIIIAYHGFKDKKVKDDMCLYEMYVDLD